MRMIARLLLPGLLLLAAAVPATAGDALYLWRVEGEGATVHLTGSIHVGKPEFFPLAEPIEAAFAAAPVLAVEVDAESPENAQAVMTIMMQKGMLPGDETLQDHLEPEVWSRLEAWAVERGVTLAMFSKFKPGIAAMVLSLQEYQRQGFDPTLGIDKHFLDAARAAGKEVRELETVADQMDLFLDISNELDDLLIDQMLDQVVDLAAFTDEMVALWRSGDAAGMDRFMQDEIGDDPGMVAFYRKLLDDRNVGMAETIDGWLRADTDVFVVVGAGHFGGEMGLVSLLEAKGWTVTQVGG